MKDAQADEDAIKQLETKWALKVLSLVAAVARLTNWKTNLQAGFNAIAVCEDEVQSPKQRAMSTHFAQAVLLKSQVDHAETIKLGMCMPLSRARLQSVAAKNVRKDLALGFRKFSEAIPRSDKEVRILGQTLQGWKEHLSQAICEAAFSQWSEVVRGGRIAKNIARFRHAGPIVLLHSCFRRVMTEAFRVLRRNQQTLHRAERFARKLVVICKTSERRR